MQVLGIGGAYNEGYVYQSYYFVKYKALFMTRMTGMTRNMKTSSDTGTANKVSEKLSFLSWKVDSAELYVTALTIYNVG